MLRSAPFPAPRENEIRGLQYARGIAALFVALYHCELLVLSKFNVNSDVYYFSFGTSGVHFFFILSGFIIYHAHKADVGRPRAWGDFWLKRAIRILPSFWLIVIPMGLAYLAFSSLGAERSMTLQKWLLDLFLVPRADKITLPPAWTLQHELIFYFIFSLVILNRAAGLAAILLWQAACLVNAVFGLIDPLYTLPINKLLGSANFGFAIGLGLALLAERVDLAEHRRVLTVCALTGLAGLGVLASSYVGHGQIRLLGQNIGPVGENLLYFLCYGLIVVFLIAVRQSLAGVADRVFDLLGSASYLLYLSHEPLMTILVKVLAMLGVAGNQNRWLLIGVIVATCCASAIALHLVFERPVSRYLRQKLLPARLARRDAVPA